MKNLPIITLAILLSATAPTAYAAVANDKSASYVRDAEEKLEKGDVNAAIIQMKNAVVSDPKNAATRVALGDLYMRVGNAPSAEKEYLRAIELGADPADVVINLSKVRLLQRQYRTVLDNLDVDAVDEDEVADAYLIIGTAHQGLNDLDKALEAFTRGEELRGKDDNIAIAIAQLYFQQKDMTRAEEKVDHALAINPKNVKGLILKGEIVHLKHGAEKSLSYFEQAVSYEPQNVAALFKTAGALYDLKRTDEALEKLDVIYNLVPKHPLANYLSAVIYAQKNDMEKAEEFLNASGSALDNFPGALMLRGVMNYHGQNYAQAIYHLNKLINDMPDNVMARRLLGASLLRQNDPEQAVKVLMPVVQADQAESVVYALLGSAHMKLGNFEEGTSFYEKAVASKPGENKLKTQLALSRLVSGDAAAAEANLQEILNDDPNSKQAAVFLTLISLRQENFDKAIENADVLIGQAADNPVGYNLKGAAYAGLKQTGKARELFRKALEVSPDYHSASLNLARLEMAEGQEEKAVEIYQDILKKDANYTGALIAMARHSVTKNLPTVAEEYYKRVVNAAPKNIAVRVEFSEFYIKQKKMERARAIAQQIIADFPNHGAGYEARGNIDSMMGDHASAVSNFGRMAALLGDNAGAYQLLGRAQMRNKDIPAARKAFKTALDYAENKSPVLMELASLEAADKNFDQAFLYIDQLKELNPKNPTALVLEGRLYSEAGKFDQALESFKAAKDLGAQGSRFTVDVSRAHLNNGDLEKGREIMRSWLEKSDNDIIVRHLLASSYLERAEYNAAIGEYAVILKHDDDNPVALNNIAWLYSQVGQNDKALATAKQAYDMFPEEASFIDTYAWILVQQGENDKGLELLQQAVAKAPKMAEIRYHLAVALHNAGKKAIAKKELEDVIASGANFAGIEEARKLLVDLSQ